METFELHITGDPRIPEVGPKLGLRCIAVDLLTPDLTVLRTEYMTSERRKFNCVHDCLTWVRGVEDDFREAGVRLIRTKVECPAHLDHYVSRSLYLESHFPSYTNMFSRFPLSRSQHKNRLTATDRVRDRDDYQAFKDTHHGRELELCLLDTFPDEDKDWFQLYGKEV